MADLATVADVESRWRPLTAEQLPVALALLGDASRVLRARQPDLDTRIAAGTLDGQLVAGVVARAVLRVLRNPDGKVQESIDDYAFRRADAVADGLLYVDPGDLALVGDDSPGAAFGITPAGEPGYRTTLPLNAWELNL